MPQFIDAKDIRHHFGGTPSSTPYTPTQADADTASVIRTPLAKPETLEAIFDRLWDAHGNGEKPLPEYTFFEGRRWRFDRAFVSQLVAVELDGIVKQAGGGRHNTDADRDKLNSAASEGWRVLRFSRAMLEDQPERCAELVIKALNC